MENNRVAQIWVDADATPKPIREVICKAAQRAQVRTIFVANHSIPLPPSTFLIFKQVPAGFDIADNLIAQECQAQDLIITQDIPLAAEVLAKGSSAINNRGEPFSPETIKQKLNMRDFLETLRASGIQSGGAAPFSDKDKMLFANALDRWLTKNTKKLH